MQYNNKRFISGEIGGSILAVLENCEPKNVFHYFEEICKIPVLSSPGLCMEQVKETLKMI